MDRRLILAVALSAIILFAFQAWFAPDRTTPPPDTAGPTASDPANPADPVVGGPPSGDLRPGLTDGHRMERDPASGSELPPPEVTGADEEILTSHETPLYRAEFTNRGGRLRLWNLKDYRTTDGVPVSLVRSRAELGLVIESPGGDIDLRNALFAAREETTQDGKRIVYEATTAGGLRVVRTFVLPDDGYMVDATVEISGSDADAYRLTWDGGIPPAEASNKQYDSAAGTLVRVGNGVKTEKPGSFKDGRAKLVEGNVKWAGVRNKYFAAIIVPPPETVSRVVATGDAQEKITGAAIVLPLLRGQAAHQFEIYLGPLEYERMKELGYELDQAVDLGWRVFRPLSSVLLKIMTWMYEFLPNYGLVIIIISAITKLLFYPLTKSSLRSMRDMQRLQPRISELRDKYKSDPQRMQAETMKLYKEHKVNPLGGCLPMVVQMPVFIALYSVLNSSIAMRQAPFVGWINDLSSPDTIGVVAGFGIHILPVIMFLTTLLQQKLTPMSDPRQKMLGYMMPAVMLIIFYSFPAGLTLYWTINNALQVGQQWWMQREPAPAIPATTTT